MIALLLYIIPLISCNRIFLAKKSRVLYFQDGYVFEQSNQMLFIPMTAGRDFLSQVDGSKAYKIDPYCDYNGAKYVVGDSLVINMHYIDGKLNQEVTMEEKIYIVRVRLTYSLLDKNRSQQRLTTKFDYKGKNYIFTTYSLFNGDIYRMSALDSTGSITGFAM